VKRRLTLAATALTATVVLLTGCSSSDAVEDVDVAGAAAIVEQGEAVILDVRTPEEYAAGHLAGAININVESPDFADQVSDLDESAETLVYCRTGNRSGIATDEMADLGFTDLADLQGGIEAWAAEGEQIVR
jgi:rhodanese-related sulfurtransferase